MLGIPNAELFLIIGATAALLGPKDLPMVARAAGRLVGRAIGYLAIARQHIGNVTQQSQAIKVTKELQELHQQVDAIRYELRGYSIMNPGPLTRSLMDGAIGNEKVDESLTNLHRLVESPATTKDNLQGKVDLEKLNNHAGRSSVLGISSARFRQSNCRGPGNNETIEGHTSRDTDSEDHGTSTINVASLQVQAVGYARLAESATLMKGSLQDEENKGAINEHGALFTVLPVSAESTGLLPDVKVDARGSDIMLEAILEEQVAHNFKQFLGSQK